MSVECSQAAMQLIEKNLGKFPVKAVIISHSHADHFGGIAGVMTKGIRRTRRFLSKTSSPAARSP